MTSEERGDAFQRAMYRRRSDQPGRRKTDLQYGPDGFLKKHGGAIVIGFFLLMACFVAVAFGI